MCVARSKYDTVKAQLFPVARHHSIRIVDQKSPGISNQRTKRMLGIPSDQRRQVYHLNITSFCSHQHMGQGLCKQGDTLWENILFIRIWAWEINNATTLGSFCVNLSYGLIVCTSCVLYIHMHTLARGHHALHHYYTYTCTRCHTVML